MTRVHMNVGETGAREVAFLRIDSTALVPSFVSGRGGGEVPQVCCDGGVAGDAFGALIAFTKRDCGGGQAAFLMGNSCAGSQEKKHSSWTGRKW